MNTTCHHSIKATNRHEEVTQNHSIKAATRVKMIYEPKQAEIFENLGDSDHVEEIFRRRKEVDRHVKYQNVTSSPQPPAFI